MKKVELSEYIKYIKEEIKKSEEPKPQKGFWIGMQSAEITFETITEITTEGELKIYFASGLASEKKKDVQTIKINLVSQDFL